MGRVGLLVAALVTTIALLVAITSPTVSAEEMEPCGFLDGFRALRSQLGADFVGDCLEHSRATADGVEQRTTGGLLVWNKAINLVSFTDGHQTWVGGPNGIEVRPNSERFAWEEAALRAAEAEAAARTLAVEAPSPRDLALLYVERVRGNNDVSLEKIYLTAYYQARYALDRWFSEARAGLSASLRTTTHRLATSLGTLTPSRAESR